MNPVISALTTVLLLPGVLQAQMPVDHQMGMPALSSEDSYKKYAQIYCAKDTIDADCQAKFSNGYGAVLARWRLVCNPKAKNLEWLKSEASWLKEFDEECTLVVGIGAGSRPSLLSPEQWQADGRRVGYDALIAQHAGALDGYQRGYDAALRMNETLKNEAFSKNDFESALKRRTERMMPDHGTKQDSKLRVINVIYVYLGAEAKDFLIGADGKSGKLGFLEDLHKVKDSEKLKDEEKYLSASARKALADQKALAAQGAKGKDQARKMAEELTKGLKGQIEGLAKGNAASGAAPADAAVASPFWSGSPRSAEQAAREARLAGRTQLPKSLNTKATEPPAVVTAELEKKRFEGCHSFLGWKCAVEAVKIAVGGIVSGGKKVGHETKEATIFGPKSKQRLLPMDTGMAEAAGPPDPAAELASIQRWTREAITLADAATAKARSAAEQAQKAAAGNDPDAVAAAAAALAAGEEALQHAAEAKEKALAAIAAGAGEEARTARDLANTSAVRADVAARRALGFADAAEAAAKKQADRASVTPTRVPPSPGTPGASPTSGASILSVPPDRIEAKTYAQTGGVNITEVKDRQSNKLLEIHSDAKAGVIIQVVPSPQVPNPEIVKEGDLYRISNGSYYRYYSAQIGAHRVSMEALDDIAVNWVGQSSLSSNPSLDGNTRLVRRKDDSEPRVYRYSWGSEMKDAVTGRIVEVRWKNGDFIKLLDPKAAVLFSLADRYVISAGTNAVRSAGAKVDYVIDKLQVTNDTLAADVVILRNNGEPSIQEAAPAGERGKAPTPARGTQGGRQITPEPNRNQGPRQSPLN